MYRVVVLAILLGCHHPQPAAAPGPPAHPRTDANGEVFGAYRVQDRPADARLLAESPAGREWYEDGWSVWWHDGTLWVHRVTCGRCRAVQGWTWIVPLDDPDAWERVIPRSHDAV